jgi:3'-5' exoribonuclease 1
MEHWKDIKEKLLHLRTQIRNREEFDTGLFRLFGEEWSRTVRDGSVEDDAVMFESSVTSIDGERCSPSTLARRTPGGTAPPSPIGTQGEDDFKERSLGTSPPPTAAAPPPLLGGKPSPQHSSHPPSTTARYSPPPAPPITPPFGSGGPLVNSSPVTSRVAGYHLESRDEMIRRRNNSMNGSMSSFNSSMGGGGVMGGGGAGGFHTPKNRSLSNSPLMGPMMGPVVPPGLLAVNSLAGGNTILCPFDYILVIDFEATCDEPNPHNFLHEIIEFPVVVVDVQLRRVCMEFHSFVRPMMHPILSTFCKQLTGIRQEDVDTAPTLPEVIRRFEVWFKNSFPPHARVIFATDGPWDMRDFMYNHSHKRSGVHFPQLFYQWVDVKQAFANFFHMNRQRIIHMLEYLGLPHEGRLHSGIDDSRNIAKIVIGLLIRGCSLCDIDRLPYLGAPASIDSSSSAATHGSTAS